MRIAILDSVNQDIGLKILFPEADYFIHNSEDSTIHDRYDSYRHYNFTPSNDLSRINDNNYDCLFIIIALYDILPTHYYIDNIKNYILAVDKVKDLQEALNDPFGLNELARQFLKEALIETWNPEESFVSLSRYMIDNGMNIQPLPKIKVIKDDEQNASNLLGKTAYYNPVEKSITLYTMDRHPKDVLRSFAHEMIHHEQNLDGRLNNINTTNTNESGDLPEIEREAYEKGNMMLRNWEDKIKNV